jgi:iron(III) transport system substrate-binding protein
MNKGAHHDRRLTMKNIVLAGLLMTSFALATCGCRRDAATSAEPVAVLYTSVDETFAREVVARYEAKTNRKLALVTDTEAGKTTGLIKRLRLEKNAPRGDVFWSSEQVQTVLLAREGLLAPYAPPTAADIPAEFKDAQNRWTAIALRARVMAIDTARAPTDRRPAKWEDLASAEFAKDTTIANPLFGTTRTHAAAMLALWGPQRFRTFLEQLVAQHAFVADSNGATMRRVLNGDSLWACTDSDDVLVAQGHLKTVEMIYPDMGDGGTLLIPNTVALIANAPHEAGAKQLIDFLVSAEVEEMLARSESGNYPVRAELRARLGKEPPPASHVSADAIADAMPEAVELCRQILIP